MCNSAALTRCWFAGQARRALAGAVLAGGFGLLLLRAEPAAAPDLAPIRAKAEQDDTDAQNTLGNAYTNALGVKQDFAEALGWYRRAAVKGFAPAQFNLGLAYELGRGLPADDRQAFKYYLMAAEQGFGPAQYNVGNMYTAGRGSGQDLFEATLWYKQAAEKGIIEAQVSLGLAYEAGRGVKKDEAQAAKWYRLAADRGFAQAQYNLGLLLEDGRGVAKDEAAAAALYRAAADQGFALAQNNYGLMFMEGRGGLPKDPVQAYVWLSRAVERGAKPAGRDFVAKDLTAGQLAEANRLLNGQKAGPVTAAASAPGAPAEIVAVPLRPAAPGATNAAAPVTEQADAQLTAANQRLQQEAKENGEVRNQAEQLREQNRRLTAQVLALTAARDTAEAAATQLSLPAIERPKPAAASLDKEAALNRLQQENARLNAELKKAATEMLALHQQMQILRSRPAGEAADNTGAQLGTPPADRLKQLQAQVQSLQAEKAELEKWTQSLERTVNDKSAAEEASKAQLADLRQKLAEASKPAEDTDARKQLAEANQALEKSGASVAELTAENERLGKELAAAKRGGADAGGWGAKNEQLARDNEQLTAFMTGNRQDLNQAQARVAELEKQLAAAKAARLPAADDPGKRPRELVDANQTIEKLNTTVAELTGTNDKLEKDLENARKSTEAALAAQTQAVTAAQPDAYKMEISTLQAHVKELEGQMEEERNNTAKEISSMAAQLQRTRDTNKSLTDSNRALLAAKDSDTSASRDELDQLQHKVRDLTAVGDELRRQNLRLTAESQSSATDLETLKGQLVDARKVATVLPGLADEKAALQEKLETTGAQLVKAQQDLDAAQKGTTDLTAQLAASRQAADKSSADLAALQTRATEAEKAAEAHSASVAELTQANAKFELEREDTRRLMESYRADIARLTQNVRNSEDQRAEAVRSGQQNIDALTAQLGQLRHELDTARTNQARLAESGAAQERERASTIAQLRQDSGALQARLSQAQGTLDQIAATARLGTPAAAIASGGTVPVRPMPVVSTGETQARFHTVAEGDSLSRISLRYYGTPNRWQEIFQANRDLLQGSSALRIGMQLRIP